LIVWGLLLNKWIWYRCNQSISIPQIYSSSSTILPDKVVVWQWLLHYAVDDLVWVVTPAQYVDFLACHRDNKHPLSYVETLDIGIVPGAREWLKCEIISPTLLCSRSVRKDLGKDSQIILIGKMLELAMCYGSHNDSVILSFIAQS